MTRNTTKTSRGLSRRTVFISALVALALSILLNGYFYSLEGNRGLYTWHPIFLLKFLLFMGLGPISIAVLALPLEKLAKKLAMYIVRWLSFLGSIFVGLVSVGILAYVIIVPRLGSLEPARLNLIDPSRGFQPITAQTEAGFSASITQNGAASATNPQVPAPMNTPTAAAATSASTGTTATAGMEPLSPLDRPLLRLSFSSDPHWGADTGNETARTDVLKGVAARKPDAFFMLGDTVDMGNSATQWNFALSDLESLLPNVPLRPIMGNHDAFFGGQYLYHKAFYPKGFSSDSDSPYYWSLDAGPATIVALDLPWGTEMFGKRQRAWLEKTLAAANPHKPIIVISHSYFYSSGYIDKFGNTPWYDHYQNIPALVPLFEKYGVDLVISGHNHYQELLAHNGVTYVIIGSMGGLPDPEPTHVSPYSKWINVGDYGWLDVDVLPARIILTFRSETGEVRESATVNY